MSRSPHPVLATGLCGSVRLVVIGFYTSGFLIQQSTDRFEDWCKDDILAGASQLQYIVDHASKAKLCLMTVRPVPVFFGRGQLPNFANSKFHPIWVMSDLKPIRLWA
ncbi:hypothetical protein C8J57DRAFT_1239050 [Mycena rebaudengoi]|nr:hypothetical protein C8J57DRAFT_1239050 [Mycena rebaudengoi]